MLSDQQLQTYRQTLLKRRETLRREHAHHDDAADSVELDQSRVGRVSRMDALQQHALHEAAGARREAELRGIGAALQRLEQDIFGLCVSCGEEIPPARLDIDAATALCIGCAERAEQR